MRIFRKGTVFHKARILCRKRGRFERKSNHHCPERGYAPRREASQKQNPPCAEPERRRLLGRNYQWLDFSSHIIFVSSQNACKSFSFRIRNISACPKCRCLCRGARIGGKNRCSLQGAEAREASSQP